MTTYHSRELSFYRISALGLGLLILLVSVSGSIGIVWLRHKIARSAVETARLERTFAEEERAMSRVSAQIAQAESPEILLAQTPKGLRPTLEQQIVWLPDPMRHMRAESTLPVASRDAVDEASPRAITFDLALLTNRRNTYY